MSDNLKRTLEGWARDVSLARNTVAHLLQLGLEDRHLPSEAALRAGCLALQHPDALARLRNTLVPWEGELLDHGVLHPCQRVAELSGGELVVLQQVLDKLPVIAEQMDSMLERARDFSEPEEPVPGRPSLVLGAGEIRGHRYQMAQLQVRVRDADRLLVLGLSQEVPRVLLFPPETVLVQLPIAAGELLLYAENTVGAALRRLPISEVSYA